MTTTPTNGVAIQPIVYPLNEGTEGLYIYKSTGWVLNS